MKNNGFFSVVLFFFIILCNFPQNCAAQSSAITAGINSLASSQLQDASWGSDSLQTDPTITTAAVLQALSELDGNGSVYQAGNGWLAAQSLNVTDHISRRILAGAPLAEDSNLLLANLDEMRKAWGGVAGYDVNISDTALALLALKKLDSNDSSTIGYGLNFLLSHQNTDGGWGFADGYESEIYHTALADLVLQRFSTVYSLSSPISRGQSFILLNQNVDGGFGYPDSTVSETAVACLALLNSHLDSTELTLALQYLIGTQLSDGSWGDDPFETSLALLALARNEKAHLPPAPSVVIGKLISSVNGQPLAGVSVTLSGNAAVTTASDGLFTIGGLNAGTYTLQCTLAGYQPLSKTVSLAAGATYDLGNLVLTKIVLPVTAIRGTVTATDTGLPVVGATVSVSGASVASAVTDANGDYEIEGLSSGTIVIVIAKAGYTSALAGATIVTNQTLLFSPALIPAGNPSGGGTGVSSLTGQVIDNSTGLPLAGVNVVINGNINVTLSTLPDGTFTVGNLLAGTYSLQLALAGYQTVNSTVTIAAGVAYDLGKLVIGKGYLSVTAIKGTVTAADTGLPVSGATVSLSGANAASVMTDATGGYVIENLTSGSTAIVVSKSGYESSSGVATVVVNQTLIFSPALLLSGSTPPGEVTNNAGLAGQVLDDETLQPLAGVEVILYLNGVRQTVTSDADGAFIFSGLVPGSTQFACNLAGYSPYHSPVLELQDNIVLDVGQIAMMSAHSANLLPDLVIEKIDTSSLVNDPQTLAVTGSIAVTVKNSGRGEARPSIGILAFYDANSNSAFDSGTDLSLSHGYTSSTILSEVSEVVPMALNGVMPYRNAPISVVVDYDEVVNESNEGNNVSKTSDSCSITAATGALNPVVKFHALQGTKVSSTPMVARLTDSNGDGIIDEKDIPDIAVVDHSGRIHVLSGDDGREIFVTSSSYPARLYNEIAIADLDGDHLPELVVAHQDANHLMAFDHTGNLKWLSDSHPLPATVYLSGVISIADLDRDGVPEIIVGGAIVFSSTGTFLADGRDLGGTIGWNFATAISSIADINLDGFPEIIAGPTAYQFINGKLSILWTRPDIRDGFSGIGNFDDDEFAEIVIVGNGNIYMLNHDGSDAEVWNKPLNSNVVLPDRGYGGPPTIADFDGDNISEIGIAGASNYVVFERNGAVRWATRTTDASSSITGSTSFDFEGDGSVEIIYRDEQNFQIFRGTDGLLLYKMSVGAGTGVEMPVVADLDNDGHAEIAVTSDNDGTKLPEHTGVYVFEDANDSWMPTRAIWNEHGYHINNINDDGTIPQFEQPSWLTHNTYRLNTFADRNPLATADLSAGMLRVVDNGLGVFKLTVRIGNGGSLAVSKNISVNFYEGDPEAGGRLLGTVNLAGLADNTFIDVTLEDVRNLTGAANIFAVVDPDGLIEECNNANDSLQVAGPPIFADLEISGLQITDNGATVPVTLTFTVANSGAISTPNQSLVAFYSGSPLSGGALLGTMNFGTLAPGASQQLSFNGVSGNDLGTELYVVVDADDQVREYSECNNTTHLTVPQSNSGVVTVSSDSPAYGGSQPVQILAQITNTSALPGEFRVRFQIEDTKGIIVATLTSVAVGWISGGGTSQVSATWSSGNLLAGAYVARAYLDSSVTQAIHTATSSFAIIHDNAATSTLGLRTTTDKTTYLPGETVKIDNLITNQTSNTIVDNTILRMTISDVNGVGVFNNEQSPGQLLPGMQKDLSALFALAALPAGQYTVKGEVVGSADGHLWASGQTAFTVAATTATGAGLTGSLDIATPVYMGRPLTLAYSVTNKGNEDVNNLVVRILIINPETDALLQTVERLISVNRQNSFAGSVSIDTAQLEPGLYMAVLSVATSGMAKSKTLGSENFELLPSLEVAAVPADPLNLLVWINDGCSGESAADANELVAGESGEKEVGKECVRIGLLESILATAVDSHYLVYDRAEFEKARRSPYFTDILILGDQAPLTAHNDIELREMVYSGTGLISALWSENTSAEQIFGIKVNGSFANGCKSPRVVTTVASPVTTDGAFSVDGRLLKVGMTGGQTVAGWVPDDICGEGGSRHVNDDPYPAIVLSEYGNGKSVFFNFNLGAELKADNLAQFREVLTMAIADVHVPRTTEVYRPYQLVPTSINLHSLGGAFDLRLTESYSPELRLFDPLVGVWLIDNPQITETTLGADEQKNLSSYVLLPDQPGKFFVTTEIGFIFGGEYSFFDSRLTEFAVQVSAQGLLQEIITEIQALGGSKTEKVKIKNALVSLQRLEIGPDSDRSASEKNITNIEQAINALLELNRGEIDPIRLKLDELLKIEQSRWYLQVPIAIPQTLEIG